MSHGSSQGGGGEGCRGPGARPGMFGTNTRQHDAASARSSYNITNQHPSTSTAGHSGQGIGIFPHKESPPAASSLVSPALVATVSRLKLGSAAAEDSCRRTRSDSGSSASSCGSTGTVCESEIFPYGKGITPHQRKLRSRSPPTRTVTKPRYDARKEVSNNNKVAADVTSYSELGSNLSEKVAGKCGGVKAGGRRRVTPDPGPGVSSHAPAHPATTLAAKPVANKIKMDIAEDDNNSVSTVSGSGIDFFRKFVQRKASSCKDCEEQFRREVLIDRLVSDSINTKAVWARKGSTKSSTATPASSAGSGLVPGDNSARTVSEMSDNSHSSVDHSLIVSSLGMHEMEQKARGCASRCKTHRNNLGSGVGDEVQSVSTKSSLSRSSSISGSGLLFLRNYLKKKKSKSKTSGQSEGSSNKDDAKNISAFNIVPVPFPPPSDFYGPAYLPDGGSQDSQDCLSEDTSSGRRHSVCSTVADLLAEDFDCDDSELKNLDWEEWDEPLPDEISYDDLVSVISESFYSEDMDISELCEIDWEGRKTVVANENQVLPMSPEETDTSGSQGQKSNLENYKSISPQHEATDIPSSSRSKYSDRSFRSSTFLQDLEAELELPPMTPVSDQQEEAVRALSRTIKQYMRTGSNSSYSSYNSNDNTAAAPSDRKHSSRLSNCHNEQGRYSPRRRSTGEELERNSRMSVYSPAVSDYLPELAPTNPSSSCVSPLQPHRRPLSQLLMLDPGPEPEAAVSSPVLGPRPVSQLYCGDPGRTSRFSRERSKTPSPELRPAEHSSGSSVISTGYIFSQNSNLHKRIHCEGKAAECGEAQPRLYDQLRQHKAANRDSLLYTAAGDTPPPCSSPGAGAGHRPASTAVTHSPRQPFLRHSSCNSTDSGCHILEEKLASVSPTPSPRTNIETVLNNNRNKLASFWEKSVSNSVIDIHHSWLPNKDTGPEDHLRHGFKPFKSAFGSENSLIVNDRLSQFQDMTRRAAERNVVAGAGPGGGRKLTRSHRASTGSDCSDFLDKITLSPAQPRRRESFTEYFV